MVHFRRSPDRDKPFFFLITFFKSLLQWVVMFQKSDVIESNLADRRVEASRRLIMTLFARMDAVAMAIAMGVVFAVGLFLATAILLLKGVSPGMPVGGNLSALVTFLPGYEVSWWGRRPGQPIRLSNRFYSRILFVGTLEPHACYFHRHCGLKGKLAGLMLGTLGPKGRPAERLTVR